VKFKILGPLEVSVGSQRLELGGARQQIVMAMLLLNANRVVTTDRLLEAIYGEDLPPTARSQLQISISSLRRLFASHGSDGVIETRPHGYLVQVGGGLDAQQFEQLLASTRTAREADELAQAVACYRDALRLWRGPALVGIESDLVRVIASRLDEQRIASNEDCLDLELELGRHHELVGELTQLVEEFPLREQLRGQLMLALYRCDRTAEALQVYRQARRIMVDELGIEPGERLQQLEHAILSADPALDLPSASPESQPPRPQALNLLPTDIADFTGREEQLKKIGQQLVREDGRHDRLAVPVVVIVGRGGVGKTTIAVHASHSLAPLFPDGQLFADLHGGAPRPVSPTQVLERFLRALGVSGSSVPDGLDERAEMYRYLLADRRVLVVLDDAVGESQVVPLLPGSETGAVMITSRRRLTGLAGAVHIPVTVFDAEKSLQLLAHIAGDARVQSEAGPATEVAEHCGYLPLALRIAGAKLSARPHWSIQQMVDRLADESRRLDELRHGNMGIRSSISLTYESAGEQARRLFRRLALLDVPIFSGWITTALLDLPHPDAEDLLDELVNAQLVEPVGSGVGVHSQYRVHDLIRVFARERLVAEEPLAERKAALQRALGALLFLAEEAHRRHHGGDYCMLQSDALRWPLPSRLVEQLTADPLLWYDRERVALVSGVRQAAQAGAVDQCWSLALAAVTLFESRIYLEDWRETHDIALEATQRARSVRGQAAMLYSIGSLDLAQLRFDEARQAFAKAAELFTEAGDDLGGALVTRHLASIDRLNGRLEDATRRYEQALVIFQKAGDHVGTAFVLHSLAQAKLELGDRETAKELLREALGLVKAARCARVESQVLHRLGETHLLAGELSSAVEAFELALETIRDLNDPIGEAYVLRGMAVARLRQGRLDEARVAFERSLELAHTTGERLAEARTLLGMGELALAGGDPGQAIDFGQQASGIFRDMGALLYDGRALTLLSDAHAALGDIAAADAMSAEAAALTRNLAANT
jgi:DNA-binding SARP family transcriptional activator